MKKINFFVAIFFITISMICCDNSDRKKVANVVQTYKPKLDSILNPINEPSPDLTFEDIYELGQNEYSDIPYESTTGDDSSSSIDTSVDAAKGDDVDYDLSDMNFNIVTSINFDMAINPEKYFGKTVKMRGQFFSFVDSESSKRLYACLIYDATACCQAGVDFVLTGNPKFPNDFPAEETFIEVVGTFTDFSDMFTDGRSYSGILCDKIKVLNKADL